MEIKKIPWHGLQEKWVDKQDHNAPIRREWGNTERDDECH